MAFCSGCFLFDEFVLHSRVGFFESRKEMVIFMINVIMNIQNYANNCCKCIGQKLCLPCEVAEIFQEKVTFEIYKNCFNLDFLLKIKDNLCIQLVNLHESHDHFLCKILNEQYKYNQEKCIFILVDQLELALEKLVKSGKKLIDKIVNQKSVVIVRDFLKEFTFSISP